MRTVASITFRRARETGLKSNYLFSILTFMASLSIASIVMAAHDSDHLDPFQISDSGQLCAADIAAPPWIQTGVL